jgi:hypothetical protein
VFVDAAGAVGAAAVAEGEATAVEVSEEFVPFRVGGPPVFLTESKAAAAGDEGPVPVDGFLWVEGFYPRVALMSLCPNRICAMWGHPVHDGVGGEDPAEVVGWRIPAAGRRYR